MSTERYKAGEMVQHWEEPKSAPIPDPDLHPEIRIRIVAWKKDGEGRESILDIVEIQGDPFYRKGQLRMHQSRHLKRLLMDSRVSRVQLEAL